MSYKSNLSNVINMFESNIDEAMEQCGSAGVKKIKSYTPVDTGELKASTEYKRESKDSVTFFNEQPYASFVEFGTYKMAAQSYFRKGLVNSLSKFKSIIFKEMSL